MKTSKIFISLSATFCVALLFSCTSVDAPEPLPPIQQENTSSSSGNANYCVNPNSQICLQVVNPECPSGWISSNWCPYSSSSGTGAGSSSSGSGSGCTAANNTNTQYCSNGIMKTYGSTPEVGGRTYKTVVIGTQTWMAENLNYKTPDGNSRCHPGNDNTNTNDADNANCNTYGRLYNWATAIGINSSFNSSPYNPSSSTKYRGVCPIGWHIPNNDEWNTLMNSVGGSSIAGRKLKVTSGWNDCGLGSSYSYQCEDAYGFSALPGGGGYSVGSFIGVGDYGNWWSASEDVSSLAYYSGMNYNYEDVGYVNSVKSDLFSVRCLQD